MQLPAVIVYAMAAVHEDDGALGGEHVVATNGTVAVSYSLDALVSFAVANSNASPTRLEIWSACVFQIQ